MEKKNYKKLTHSIMHSCLFRCCCHFTLVCFVLTRMFPKRNVFPTLIWLPCNISDINLKKMCLRCLIARSPSDAKCIIFLPIIRYSLHYRRDKAICREEERDCFEVLYVCILNSPQIALSRLKSP